MLSIFKKKKTIVTHNGPFHTDDIFAVATLCLVFEKEYSLKIIRTRDPAEINKADLVVDVGDSYDTDNNRFDHHQEGRAGVRDNGIPYASFGLVWNKFGEQLCGDDEIARSIETKLVLPIDALDNGVEVTKPVHDGIYGYTIGDMFRSFRPTWKEGIVDIDRVFIESVQLAKKILKREIIKAKDEIQAMEAVMQIYKGSKDKRLLILNKYYPTDIVMGKIPEALLVVFPESVNSNWCIKTVRDKENSFESKILLPDEWAGKRDSELENITGVKGAVYCHPGRFLAVAKTKEAAVALAQKALNS